MRLRVQYLLFLLPLLFTGAGCSSVNEGFHELWTGSGKLLSRIETKKALQTAIFLNIQTCPANYDAGLLGIDNTIAQELTNPYYVADSVDQCVLLIMATPCNLNPNSDTLLFQNLYRAEIRFCGLRSSFP